MTDTTTKVREHYSGIGLADRIKAALTTIALSEVRRSRSMRREHI